MHANDFKYPNIRVRVIPGFFNFYDKIKSFSKYDKI